MSMDKLYRTDWLDIAVNSLLDKLRYYIDDRAMSLNQAIAETKRESTAGPKAWDIALDKIKRSR